MEDPVSLSEPGQPLAQRPDVERKQWRLNEYNFTLVPPELAFWDEHATEHWQTLLNKSGTVIGKNRVDERRLYILANFGLPDLVFRLECQSIREARRKTGYDHVARARIWLHVTEATTEGRDIADVSSETMWRLNAFLPKTLHFENPRFVALKCHKPKPERPKKKRRRASRRAKELVWGFEQQKRHLQDI